MVDLCDVFFIYLWPIELFYIHVTHPAGRRGLSATAGRALDSLRDGINYCDIESNVKGERELFFLNGDGQVVNERGSNSVVSGIDGRLKG